MKLNLTRGRKLPEVARARRAIVLGHVTIHPPFEFKASHFITGRRSSKRNARSNSRSSQMVRCPSTHQKSRLLNISKNKSALFNFQSLLLALLLLICTSAYAHYVFPGIMDRNKDGSVFFFGALRRHDLQSKPPSF